MDHEDGTPTLFLTIETEFEGPNIATLNKWAADALRRLADKIERNEFEDGHHPVTDNVGKPVGEVYFDYSNYELRL